MKKNILILVDSLKIGGGSDKVAAILGSELHNKGYNVSFLTLMDDSPKYNFKGSYYTLNERDIYGNDLKRGLNLLKYSPKVKDICEELKIDTIISAGDPANFHAIFSRLFFKNRVQLIITQHMNPDIFKNSPMKYRLIKFFYTYADEIICVSKEIERIFKEDYGFKNTSTIYNMMDIENNLELSLEEVSGRYKEFYKNPDKNFNFINIGRLNRQKGQWFLIRSFRKVVDKHKNARLFILGIGDLKDELEALIHDLHLDRNVFLLGEQENIFPFLKNSDCFILTSLWEGLPMALIEALSMNIPIISTDCKTGPREILSPELDLNKTVNYPYYGNYAILTQPLPNELLFKNLKEVPLLKSEEILVESMIKIIEDKNLRMDYSNGQKIARNFDKEKILSQWNKLLK